MFGLRLIHPRAPPAPANTAESTTANLSDVVASAAWRDKANTYNWVKQVDGQSVLSEQWSRGHTQVSTVSLGTVFVPSLHLLKNMSSLLTSRELLFVWHTRYKVVLDSFQVTSWGGAHRQNLHKWALEKLLVYEKDALSFSFNAGICLIF